MAQYTNQAQLSYKNTVLNSNVAVGEILEVLSASKTAVRDRYSRNDDVTYVISIVNSGTTAFTGLTVSDNLGAYEFNGGTLYPLEYAEGSVRVYINGVLQTAPPTVTSLQPLVFSGLSLPANSNMTIIYEAVTTRFAPLSAAGTITNTATISGDGAGSPVTATATVTAKAEPDLTINKSIEPAVVTENGTVTYTFTIQNYGNTATAAADDVSVTDTFRPCAFQPLRRFQRHSMDRRHRIHLQRRYRPFHDGTGPDHDTRRDLRPGCRNRDMEHHTRNRNTHSKRQHSDTAPGDPQTHRDDPGKRQTALQD